VFISELAGRGRIESVCEPTFEERVAGSARDNRAFITVSANSNKSRLINVTVPVPRQGRKERHGRAAEQSDASNASPAPGLVPVLLLSEASFVRIRSQFARQKRKREKIHDTRLVSRRGNEPHNGR